MPSSGRFKQNAPGSTPKKKRAVKTTRGPQGLPIQGSSPAKSAPRKVVTRPAPVVQPGPIRESERKVIRRQQQVDRGRAQAAKDAPATRTGMADSDRKRVTDFYATKKFARILQEVNQTAHDRGEGSARASRINLRVVQATTPDKTFQPRKGEDVLTAATRGENNNQVRRASVRAPVIKILDQTMRPSRAVSGSVEAAIKGKNIPKAAERGLIKNKGPGFQKILKDAGAPKGVAAPLGFVLDVGTDPTTYATFGTSSVAKQAANRATKKAIKAGMTEAGVKTVAKAAAKKAATGSGLSVRFAGRETPGVTRATAAVAAGVSKATPKVARKAGGKVKDLARDVRPQLAPAGVDETQHVAARQASRRARAERTQGVAQAEREARDLAKRIGEKNYEKVIDAIERGQIGKLDPELRQAAVDIRSRLRYAQRVRRRSGLAEGSIKNYFPHALEDPLLKGLGVIKDDTAKPMGSGQRVIPKPGSAKVRERRGPISVENPKLKAEGKGQFSTDAPLVYLNYMGETSKVAATSSLARDLAAAGRDAKPGTTLKDGEQVYHLAVKDGRLGLREVPLEQVGKAKSGRYVVLDKRVVDRAVQSAKPAQAESTIGKAFDRGTRGFKTLATLSPGFHARNMIGDTQMAYLAQPARKLPGNMKQAGGALRVASKQERQPFERELSGKTIKVAGKTMPTERFVEMARREGVIRSGFVGRELEDLASTTVKAKRAVRKGRARAAGRRANRWMQNREDLQRLATFKDALDRGMSPGEAADRSMNFHIDYGDLTDFERKFGRRAAPFYTFSARAIPMHGKALVQTPGKFASIEKARQNTVEAFDTEERYNRAVDEMKKLGVKPSQFGWKSWQDGLQEYQQRQAPFSAGANIVSAGLPVTVLNEIPAGFDPITYLSELGNYGVQMANPLAKWPIELLAGKNMFLRKDIENENAPLVAAPSWVRTLPTGLKEAWGVTDQYVDKRTKKKTWGWYGKQDYIARALPGIFGFTNSLLTDGTSRRGMSRTQRTAAFVTGVRAEPYDPTSAAIGALMDRRADVTKELGALRQTGKTAEDKRYRELDATRKLLEWQAQALSKRRGDPVPMFDQAKQPGKNAVRIAELEAKQERLSAPLREKAKKGEVIYETPELKKIRAELKRLRGPQPKQSRVLKLPETPQEEIQRELDDFKRRQQPGAIQDEIRREIEQFKAEQKARAGVR